MRGARALGVLLGIAVGAGPALAEPPPRKLLVVTVTKGYRHESIPAAERVIERLGRESGLYAVEFARTDEELRARTAPPALEAYDGVFLANTSGAIPLADPAALYAWVGRGHALLGLHAASNTLQDDRAFVALLGGEFDHHREQVRVQPVVEDPGHPATSHLGAGFSVFDEIYVVKSLARARVRVLLSLDRHPNSGEAGDFPLAWTREEGRGRVFYTALGHRDDVIEADWYGKHLLGGVRWALGSGEPAR